jgi:hypothetical protein
VTVDTGAISLIATLVLGMVTIWYAKRGAVAAEEAVRLARIPLDREVEKERLSPLEQAVIRAAVDSPSGKILYTTHIPNRGARVVFAWGMDHSRSTFQAFPSHEPIPDPEAQVERLINEGLLEYRPSETTSLELSFRANHYYSEAFQHVRVTDKGRRRAVNIPESAVSDYREANGIGPFQGWE